MLDIGLLCRCLRLEVASFNYADLIINDPRKLVLVCVYGTFSIYCHQPKTHAGYPRSKHWSAVCTHSCQRIISSFQTLYRNNVMIAY